MIAQYAAAFPDVEHIVVEHDRRWIEFFSRNLHLSDRTHVLHLDWDYVAHKSAGKVRVYAGFEEALNSAKFDLISIDGPLGGDMDAYARIDVLQLMPGCLSSSFAIMVDDCDRLGELATVYEMQQTLAAHNIRHQNCRYSGMKDLKLLCSDDLSFLCSL